MEIGFSKSLGRKRVIVSENMESFSTFTPLKRVYTARFNFNYDISLLESLPQDILVIFSIILSLLFSQDFVHILIIFWIL